MKQAVKSALGLGGASAATPLGVSQFASPGYSSYGPTIGTIPVAQTVTVPTYVDTVETIQQPVISQTTTVQKQVVQPIIEHREVAPVVHQRIRQEEVEEIQPVIHREREQTEIHKILQPMYTTSTMGVASEERTLAAQVRPEIRLQGPPAPASLIPTTEYESAQKVRVDKAPIVMETERKRVIEEIQPVVYKEVIQPHLIRVTQPIYEKIVEADVYVERVLPATTFVTPVTTTAIATQTVTPIASASTINIAEPTTAFTQTFDIPNVPQSTSRIEGVSQGMQVAPVGVSVQPLGSQYNLGIQQPFLGTQSNLLASQGGLSQQSAFGMQPNLGYPQSNLGMQPNMGFSQSNLGMQPNMGLSQSNLGYPQSSLGMQQSSLGYGQSNLGAQGFQQGYGQSNLGAQGFQQGYGQSNLGMQQGLGQSSLGQGLGQGLQSGLGMQQGSNLGMGQGIQQGLGQGLTSGLGQQLGGALGKGLASATAF